MKNKQINNSLGKEEWVGLVNDQWKDLETH